VPKFFCVSSIELKINICVDLSSALGVENNLNTSTFSISTQQQNISGMIAAMNRYA
jgi:hypothetical protein